MVEARSTWRVFSRMSAKAKIAKADWQSALRERQSFLERGELLRSRRRAGPDVQGAARRRRVKAKRAKADWQSALQESKGGLAVRAPREQRRTGSPRSKRGKGFFGARRASPQSPSSGPRSSGVGETAKSQSNKESKGGLAVRAPKVAKGAISPLVHVSKTALFCLSTSA